MLTPKCSATPFLGEDFVIDVLVLGAGIAGLTLARQLQNQGREVLICEARDRIGGRTFSPEINGYKVDLGASWIWEGETSVHALVGELGIPTYPSHSSGVDLYQDARQILAVQIPRPPVLESRIVGGTAAIASALATQVSGIVFEKPARKILAHADCLEVEFDDQTIRARHVVVGFPPALFASSVVVPDLPSNVLNMYRTTPVWMGEIAKFVVTYESPFWMENGLSGRVFSHLGPMVEVYDLSGQDPMLAPALFGFVPRSRAVDGWQERAIDQLIDLFGPQAGMYRAAQAVEWWTEEYTCPTISHPADHQLFGHAILRQPQLNGRLHLISTETSGVNTGHIDGAIYRALELAKALIRNPSGD